jgi:hypothetical protein
MAGAGVPCHGRRARATIRASLLAKRAETAKTGGMRRCFHGFIKMVFLLCLMTAGARAQAILNPPFGLRWGDSPEKLIAWASRHSLDLTISLPGDQPGLRVLKIQPRKGLLPESKAGAVEGRFLGGRLYELTVHYFDAEASADLVEARFEELRKQVTREHGALLANKQQRSVEDQFVTRTQSFHREPVKGLFLLLAFTEVEDLLRKSKDARFSLIYRNDNFRKELETELKQP